MPTIKCQEETTLYRYYDPRMRNATDSDYLEYYQVNSGLRGPFGKTPPEAVPAVKVTFEDGRTRFYPLHPDEGVIPMDQSSKDQTADRLYQILEGISESDREFLLKNFPQNS